MISVIVYGRNDAHGYNLPKRAAISLNTMAELLTDHTDEIIFVDYNTPNELPTFPEAIRDTLTDRAKRLLRIIRVRPESHWRWCGDRTHVGVVEPIARNIALRRTRPENRWVLSTNTDLVFVPTAPGTSLTEICEVLDDGFYQLPRFELPETLWESFDRTDGTGIINRVRILSLRLHLNEVVRDKLAVFDGPGDFQLALRSDLFEMFGFNEAMILGWHVDTNLTVRMRLKHGIVASAALYLRAYHCDHTRVASIYHGPTSVENSWTTFVRGADRPECFNQAEDWGYPDERFEEKSLATTDRYEVALAAAIQQKQTDDYLCPHPEDEFEIQDYPIDHVLPFLVDSLATLPPGAIVFYCGVSRVLFDRLVIALPALVEGVQLVTDASEGIEFAHILVFEFAAGRDELARVERTFLAAVDREVIRLNDVHQLPRRFVMINAIGNFLEHTLLSHLDCTRTPRSTRIRSGVVRRDTAGDWRAHSLRALMRRRWLPPVTEMRTRDDLAEMADDPAAAESRRALLSAAVVPRIDPLPKGGGLLDLYDWEDPEWFRFVRRHMGGVEAADWFARTPTVWERATFLRLLDLHGLLAQQCRILVCGLMPDELAVYASQYATVVQARLNHDGAAPVIRPPDTWLPRSALYDSSRFFNLSSEQVGPFDAIVAPRHALLSIGAELLRFAAARLRPLLTPQGKLIFSSLVDIGAPLADGSQGLREFPYAVPGYVPEMPVRLACSPATTKRQLNLVAAGRNIWRTVETVGDTVLVKAVFVLKRESE